MTPEDKAKQLVHKFKVIRISQNKEYDDTICKHCAIVLVEEILSVGEIGGLLSFYKNDFKPEGCRPFWEQVKTVIQNL